MVAADAHCVSAPERLAAELSERLANTESCDLVCSRFAIEVTDKVLQDEAPVNSVLIVEVDDLEEGELFKSLSDHEQTPSIKEGKSTNIQKGSHGDSQLEADTWRGSCSGDDNPLTRKLDSDTDKEIEEPISSFVSRHLMQLLSNLANQTNLSSLDSSSELLIKRVYNRVSTEEDKSVLGKTLSMSLVSNGKPTQGKILQEGRNEAVQLSEHGMSEPLDDAEMDGAMGIPSKKFAQQRFSGVGQPKSI